jgi:hypothetical protein
MKKITYNITENECVGDSLAKHNSNILALDAMVCNLSSAFYWEEDNYLKFFNDYYNNRLLFETGYDNFKDDSIIRYKLANAATQTLSSFWNKHEFTVQLNTNISIDYNPVVIGNTLGTDFISLCSSSWNYLNDKFPASNYMKPTTAHVVAVYYSSIQSDLSSHIEIVPIPEEFSDSNRVMNVEFTKPFVSLSGMYIFSFTNAIVNNMWLLTKVLPNVPKVVTSAKITSPIPKPTIKYVSSSPPPRPCCGVDVGWQSKKPCCNSSITIDYKNPAFGGDLSYFNIFYGTQSTMLGYLFGTTINETGSITINGLAGGTTYYITGINSYNQKTASLAITTPSYT